MSQELPPQDRSQEPKPFQMVLLSLPLHLDGLGYLQTPIVDQIIIGHFSKENKQLFQMLVSVSLEPILLHLVQVEVSLHFLLHLFDVGHQGVHARLAYLF